MSKKKNPCVFLDLCIDASPAERIVIELFADEVPKTVENFKALCTGEMVEGNTTGKPLHYKGTEIFRIHNGAFAEGGDFSNQNGGKSGKNIYGGLFADEKVNKRYSDYGVLAVYPCTQGYKFYVILNQWPHHDEGMETVKKIDSMGTRTGKPLGKVRITHCGEIPEEDKKKYVMESEKEKKKKPRNRPYPSNYVSGFYSSKRKYLLSSKSSDSDLKIYTRKNERLW